MICFLSGGAKNGKSTLAQNLAVTLSGSGKRYYVATMISSGAEDDERIRLHLLDRAGLGFETVECFDRIMDCLKTADPEGTFLLDSVTALIQNAMFPAERNYEMDLTAAQECADELEEFAKKVRNVIFVSDYIGSDAETYAESTESYRRCLAAADRRLAKISDTVVEVAAGQYTVYKGELLR